MSAVSMPTQALQKNKKQAPVNGQIEFEKKYITSAEITQRLGITRATVHGAKNRGLLPQPIEVDGLRCSLWLRKDIEPILKTWNTRLRAA